MLPQAKAYFVGGDSGFTLSDTVDVCKSSKVQVVNTCNLGTVLFIYTVLIKFSTFESKNILF